MKPRILKPSIRLIGAGLLAVACFMSVEQKKLAAQPPVDPAHAAHVAAGAMPADAANGESALAQQLSELQAKVAQLEALLARNAPLPPDATAPAADGMPAAGGMGGMGGGGESPPGMRMKEKMKGGMRGGAMQVGAPMGGAAPGGGGGSMQPGRGMSAASGMGRSASPPGVDAGMMARMDKVIGIMDRMVGMMDRMTSVMGEDAMQPAQGTPPAAGGGGTVEDDMGEMGAMQPGQAAPPMGDDM